MLGSVDLFDVSIKKVKLGGKYELNYLSSSKIRITSNDNSVNSVIFSQRGLEIHSVEVKANRFILAHTSKTLVLGDLKRSLVSEIEWKSEQTIDNCKFNETGLLWLSAGNEVVIIELGKCDILASFRTEFIKGRLISIS